MLVQKKRLGSRTICFARVAPDHGVVKEEIWGVDLSKNTRSILTGAVFANRAEEHQASCEEEAVGIGERRRGGDVSLDLFKLS